VTSFAAVPYGALTGEELMSEIESGYRLPQPADCPAQLYDAIDENFKLGVNL
jgi:hypothetical protein